jgi:hypothetical protein
MPKCWKTEIAGMPITLSQQGKNRFTVTYWKQVKDHLGYHAAAEELGAAIMHALACDSKLDNRLQGED